MTGGTRNIAAQLLGAPVPFAEHVPAAAEHAHNILAVWGLIAIAAIIGAIVKTIQIIWFPFGRCGRCKGAGILRDKRGRHHRDCPRCKGQRRLRIGRRVANYLIHARKDAQ